MCDSVQLHLPTMAFNSIEIKRESSVKFLGAIIERNLTWKNHIEVIENKISEKIGVLYRANNLLDFKKPTSIHDFHSYLHKLC